MSALPPDEFDEFLVDPDPSEMGKTVSATRRAGLGTRSLRTLRKGQETEFDEFLDDGIVPTGVDSTRNAYTLGMSAVGIALIICGAIVGLFVLLQASGGNLLSFLSPTATPSPTPTYDAMNAALTRIKPVTSAATNTPLPAEPTEKDTLLQEIRGQVSISSPELGPAIDILQDTAIRRGVTVKTGAGSSAKLLLPDGSIVRIAENTTVTLDKLITDSGNSNIQLVLEQGKIWTVVPRTLVAGQDRFAVVIPAGVVTLAGKPSFMSVQWNAENKSGIVTCLDGEDCRLQNELGGVSLTSQTQTETTPGQPPAPAHAIMEDELSGWGLNVPEVITLTPTAVPTQPPVSSLTAEGTRTLVIPATATAATVAASLTIAPSRTLPPLSVTPSPSASSTASSTASFTVSPTASFTVSPTPSITQTRSITPTFTPTFTLTTNTPTFTPTFTQTRSLTPTFTPTFTQTRSLTPSTPTVTQTRSITPSLTASITASLTATLTPSFTATSTPSFTATSTPSFTATPTPSLTPTWTATFTATLTFTPTATFTPTVTPTPTPTGHKDYAPSWGANGKIAFISERLGGTPMVFSMSSDGSNETVVAPSLTAPASRPQWRPAVGEMLAWLFNDGDSEIQIWDYASATPVTQTANSLGETSLAWSSDGMKYVYVDSSVGNGDIYVANWDGSGMIAIAAHSAADSQPTWSTNNSEIVFVSERDGSKEIWKANADGSGSPTQITNTSTSGIVNHSPAWQPGVQRLAFVSEDTSTGTGGVYVIDFDSATLPVNEAGFGTAISNAVNTYHGQLVWSPDGAKLAWVALESENPPAFDCKNIYVFDGVQVLGLTGSGSCWIEGNNFDPAWSPDGSQIAFTSDRAATWSFPSSRREIYVVPSNGSGSATLLTDY
ncbi:MAG TPA: FecR domain-containing protein [Anaerolineales bacterium]|nr:FecR domain-containing protein [Anaerolineales bacterium]